MARWSSATSRSYALALVSVLAREPHAQTEHALPPIPRDAMLALYVPHQYVNYTYLLYVQ